MLPRQRILTALAHQEPDYVPLDIGGMDVTGININAYRCLLPYLGFPVPDNIPILDTVQQIASIDEPILIRLNSHCRGLFPHCSSSWQLQLLEDDQFTWFIDEWGIKWRKSKTGGLYYDIAYSPLAGASLNSLGSYPWPNPVDPIRREGLKDAAQALNEAGDYAVILSGLTGGGPMEVSAWMNGFENFFIALLLNPDFADALLDKVLEIKLRFWEETLPIVGPYIDIVAESEDLGVQDRLMVSPKVFRQHIKPRLRQLFSSIKAVAPHVKILLHSDGAIREILPDLIEIGVDILNPIQVSAKGMGDTAFLKREFGSHLVFWGGIDTQHVLPFGSPEEVQNEVCRRIEDLAPGGGYVMGSVHNIQAGVPSENILSMLDAWMTYGKY